MTPRSIAEQFHGQPFHLDRTRGLAQVLSLIQFAADHRKLNIRGEEGDGEEDPEKESLWKIENFYPMQEPMQIGVDGIARISVKGMLSNSLPPIYEKLGLASSYTRISAEIAAAVAGGARGLYLSIDSGGGSVIGVREVYQQLAALKIPAASHTSSIEASAALYLGVAPGQSFATETAMVGSVGSILVMYDWSKFYQDYGVSPVVFASGDLKGTGVDGTSLTEEQAQYLQGLVDTSAAAFKGDVQAARGGAIEEDTMRGQMFFAGEAQSRNLLDAIASEAEVRDWLVAQAA